MAPSEVSVWRVRLDPGDREAEMRRVLSRDESERLRVLDRTDVGRRWLVSRAALRGILASELEIEPAEVRLRLGEHGRPGLDPTTHPGGLDFNLSHSGELALIAVADGLRLGIDVEKPRGRDPLRVANRYFSPTEVNAIRAAGDSADEFLRYWTAKEALAKGLGLGLQAPWGELEVAAGDDGALSLVGRGDWRLIELTGLPGGYRGALALRGAEATVADRTWHG